MRGGIWCWMEKLEFTLHISVHASMPLYALQAEL